MFIIDLQAVLFAKQVEWQRHTSRTEVSEKAGICRMTLHRMVKHTSHNAYTTHLDRP